MAQQTQQRQRGRLLLLAISVFLLTAVLLAGNDNGKRHLSQQQHQSQQSSRQLAASQLLEKFQVQKAKYMEKLATQYGAEYINLLFKDKDPNGNLVSVTRFIFGNSELSWNRFKRKLTTKMLTAQIQGTKVPFVWATGGWAVPAAHGNLFNESYTQVMHQNSKDALEAVGLDFVARPYAMGGVSTMGAELAICIKEIFGLDVDVLSYDYAVPTRHNYDRVSLYLSRASLLPNRPALVGLFSGNYKDQAKEAEDWGHASLLMDNKYITDTIFTKVPDALKKTTEENEALPSHLQYFRCGELVGIGRMDATCASKRWTITGDEDCDHRRYRVRWHTGWKWHSFVGNVLSLLLMDAIDEALQDMIARGSDAKALLDKLKAEEDQDFATPQRSKLPAVLNKELDALQDIPNDVIYRQPNFCHTGQLPAETRYQGILTESQQKDTTGNWENFDKGSEYSTVENVNNDGKPMPLTWDASIDKTDCTKYRLRIDQHDFFTYNSLGMAKLTLPNPTEKRIYGTGQPLHGFIALCPSQCGWKCPDHVVDLRKQEQNAITMTVNGKTVQSFSPFSHDCFFLKHDQGHKWTPNSQGQFEIAAKTNSAEKHGRIASLVIW